MNRWAERGLVLGFYGVVAAVFSWPMLRSPATHVISKDSDLLGMIWVMGVSPDLSWDMHTTMARWPAGQDIHFVDGLLFLLAGKAVCHWLSPMTAAALMAWAGMVVSAWAADRFAVHALGARAPFSLLAGLGYAFGGLSGTVLLTGQLYFLFNPGLPLLAWASFRLLGRRPRLRDGPYVFLAWCLCLLTSAYVAAAGAILHGALWIFHPPRSRRVLRPALLAAGLFGGCGLLFTRFVLAGGGREANPLVAADITELVVRKGLDRAALLLRPPDTLLLEHDSSSPLPFLPLFLAVVGVLVFLRSRRSRALVAAGLLGLVGSLGVTWTALAWGVERLDLEPLSRAMEALFLFYRFPATICWITGFALAVVAAQAATVLATHRFGASLLLLPLALVDSLVRCSPLLYATAFPLVPPSAYAAIPEGEPVVELIPLLRGRPDQLGAWLLAQTCAYQHRHRHPLSHACLDVMIAGGVHAARAEEILATLMDDTAWQVDHDSARRVPEALLPDPNGGISYFVLRPILLARNEREVVLARASAAWGDPVAESTDGGEWIRIHHANGPPGTAALDDLPLPSPEPEGP